MTTASNPSGSGSPVSTTTYASASSHTGVLSLAPTVSAARTATPSIADASNDGDARAAHPGAAVTRHTASGSASRTASTRCGQPASRHAARQAASASAAGTSWMKGVVAIKRYEYSVTSTSVPAGSPVASSGTTTYPSAAVSTDSSADAPNSGVATSPLTLTCTTSNRPAAEGMSRSRRARTRGSGGGSVMPPTSRTIGIPTSRKTTSAERGLPGSQMTGTSPASASSVGLPGRSAIPCVQIPGSPSSATTAAVSSRAPADEPADTTTTSHSATA